MQPNQNSVKERKYTFLVKYVNHPEKGNDIEYLEPENLAHEIAQAKKPTSKYAVHYWMLDKKDCFSSVTTKEHHRLVQWELNKISEQ
jgi:hypothetical protein